MILKEEPVRCKRNNKFTFKSTWALESSRLEFWFWFSFASESSVCCVVVPLGFEARDPDSSRAPWSPPCSVVMVQAQCLACGKFLNGCYCGQCTVWIIEDEEVSDSDV